MLKTCTTLNEVVLKLNCKRRTVQRILAQHQKRDGNHDRIQAELRGRKCIISFEDLRVSRDHILSISLSNCSHESLFMDFCYTLQTCILMIRQHLDERRGVLASISTIWRVLKCSVYTLKKVFDCSLHLLYLMLLRLQKLQLNAMS